MLQLQLQPLHSISSHLVDLLGELVSLSFSSHILKLEEDPHPSITIPRHLWNEEREQCFITSLNQTSSTNLSLNRATEFLYQSNDIIGQTSEQYLDDTSNDSRSGLTMDVVTIPLPPPSTLTPTPPAPARRSMPSTMTPANPPCLTLPSTRTPVAPLCDSSPSIIRNLQNGGVNNSSVFPPTTTTLGFGWMGLTSFGGPITPTWPMIKNCKEAQFIHIQALCMPTDPSPSLSKSRYTLCNVLSRSLLKIWCSIKNGRRRHSILVTTSSVETCIHQCQNLINRVDGNQTLSVASSMEQIIKSSYASFARAIYDHKLIRNFKLEFLKVSKDFPTFANSLKMCILDYSLSLYLFFLCIVLLSVCMNFPLMRI